MTYITKRYQLANQIQSPIISRNDFFFRNIVTTGGNSGVNSLYIDLRVSRQYIIASNKITVSFCSL